MKNWILGSTKAIGFRFSKDELIENPQRNPCVLFDEKGEWQTGYSFYRTCSNVSIGLWPFNQRIGPTKWLLPPNIKEEDKTLFDMAELMFGNIVLPERKVGYNATESKDVRKRDESTQGAHSNGHARLCGQAKPLPVVSANGNAAKVSIPTTSNRVMMEKTTRVGIATSQWKPVYKTYMDEDARIRGHKRYPAAFCCDPVLPKIQGRTIENDKKHCFEPVELLEDPILKPTLLFTTSSRRTGVLLWAIDFGERWIRTSDWNGKIFGYGSISMEIENDDLLGWNNWSKALICLKWHKKNVCQINEKLCGCFIQYMEDKIANWSTGRRFELLNWPNQ